MAVLIVEMKFEGRHDYVQKAAAAVIRAIESNAFAHLEAERPPVVKTIYDERGELAELQPTDPIFFKDIKELGLGVRAYNCLKRVGIETIGDLVAKSEPELLAIPNFGRPSLEDVVERLARRDLRLREP